MVKRTIWLLSLFAAVAAIAGCATVEAATRTVAPPRARAPSITVAPIPSTTCFVGGRICPIRPCIEPVIARPLMPQRALPPTQTICEMYPNPGARRVFVRR